MTVRTTAKSSEAMEVNDEEDDPIPNELDNALVHLIPAITACGSDPKLPTYLDLATFERLAGATLGGSNGGDSSSKRCLDSRVSGEIEVAFRHCMHEAGLALVGADTESGSGGKGGGEGGGRRTRKGKAAVGGGGGGGGGGGNSSSESEVMAGMMSQPLGILSLALEFVWNEVGLNESGGGGGGGGVMSQALSGLPLLLLEDFLESQGRKACKVFWSKWVEPNAARLTKLLLTKPAGRYTLIRLCNKLAQRMSKTHDSSFCGQIHLFLAEALGFFERSGLNVTGGINLQNITAFEDEEDFRRTMMGFDGEDEVPGVAAPEAGGDPMEVDSSAGGAEGGAKDKKKNSGDAGRGFSVDYPLYRSFWRLQRYALEQDKAVKGEEAKQTWEDLLGDVDKARPRKTDDSEILGAFESNPFSEHDLRLARERWAADGGSSSPSPPTSSDAAKGAAAPGSSKRKRGGGRAGAPAVAGAGAMEAGAEAEAGGGGPVYFGLKYLTSSRLLRLQLRDPVLRLQVLTQWLILAASLKSKIANTKDSPNSVEDLRSRIELAKRLVRATPPRGEEYLGMLQIVLNRESAWTQWKDVGKCKDVDPAAVQEMKQAEKDKAAGVVVPAPSYPNKRPRPSASVALAERAKYSPLGADFPLEKMVTKLRAGVPSSQEHLEDQRMCAQDPDTPASELPSASPLYTWRALRLLGRENPANLVGCHDGDLVKTMERLTKAQKDAAAAVEAAKAAAVAAAAATAEATVAATAAAAAAAEAAEAAAPTAATESVSKKPPKSETALPPAEEAAAEKEAKADAAKAVAVDGEEDGEVEIKTEVAAVVDAVAAKVPAAASADAGSTTDAAASSNGGVGSNGGTKGGEDDGDAAVSAAESATTTAGAASAAAVAVVPAVVVPAVVATAENDPSDSPSAADSTLVSAGAASTAASDAPDSGGTAGNMTADNGAENGDGERGGNGDGEGGVVAVPAAAGKGVASPDVSSSEKGGAVAGSLAPVADAGPVAAVKAPTKQTVPSPARMTRRRAKSVQDGGGNG
ncbi:unnamed protein product [Pylaiella littoralis]